MLVAMILDGAIVDGKLSANFFAGFAVPINSRNLSFRRREMARERV